MRDNSRDAFWEKVFAAEFVTEKNCWKSCGSFCCRWEHPDFNFLFIPHGGTLFYLEEEYGWMSRNAKVLPDTKKFSLSFAAQYISLLYNYCTDCTLCGTAFDRTLYCKLYPFLPVMSIDGTLNGLTFCSVYDLTMHYVSSETPCSVISKKDSIYSSIRNSPELLDILRDPYILFHLRIAAHIHDNYIKNLEKETTLLSLPVKDFWKKWELQYLSGKFINKHNILSAAEQDYTDMKLLYGDFL